MVGDTIWWQGSITSKYVEKGNYFVKVALEANDQVQAPSAFGMAIVLLPSREGGLPSLPLQSSD